MPELIALSDLQTITELNTLVEIRKATACIKDAHLEVEKVLGRTGYALVYANAPTFSAQSPNSAAYVTLLNDYIKPFMAWRARQRGVWDMYAEPDRSGIYVKEGNEHRAVSKSEMGGIQATYESRADSYLERLMVHLEENKSTFTWYATTLDGEERINETNAKSVAGISFRRSTRQDTYRG
jgi:hypothetical protein